MSVGMSKLETLIQQLCPDGGAIVQLKEVAHYSKTRIDATEVSCDNYVGVENLLQNKLGKISASTVPETGKIIAFEKGNILIGNIRPYLKKIWLADCSGGTNGDVLTVQINDISKLLPKFLYYVLSSDQFFMYDMQNSKGAKMPRGSKEAVMKYCVPIPPLEIQREIVRILDNFTELTAELTEKLIAELAARKKQYEYYRDALFSIRNCEHVMIKDLATTNIGLATSVTKYKTSRGVLLLHNSDIQQNHIVLKQYEYVSEEFARKNAKKLLQKDDIITVHTGDVGTSAVIGDPYIGAIGFTTITTRISDQSKITPQYLCHYLNSHRCKADIARMTISDRSNLNQNSFEKLAVPVPPLEEQHRIISILDRFDALCNDLTNGLPAEIAARQKQYEYYRDKLLTFQDA